MHISWAQHSYRTSPVIFGDISSTTKPMHHTVFHFSSKHGRLHITPSWISHLGQNAACLEDVKITHRVIEISRHPSLVSKLSFYNVVGSMTAQ